jgi:hypothetical protein
LQRSEDDQGGGRRREPAGDRSRREAGRAEHEQALTTEQVAEAGST